MPTSKRKAVAETVADRVREDRLRISDHAANRMRSRGVMPIEVQEVPSNGWHNAEQDEWKDDFCSWAYAIEGETLDGRELRIPVSFVEADDVLVVTVIDIDPVDR